MSATIFTASWRTLAEAGAAGTLDVTPVRISRGAPKFWPAAAGFAAVDELMPDGWMMGVYTATAAKEGPQAAMEKFGRCYRRRLHTQGLTRIQARLDAIAEQHEGKPLALACFEDRVEDCHRGPSGFAGWYERKTGVRVPELALLTSKEDGNRPALVYEVAVAMAEAVAA